MYLKKGYLLLLVVSATALSISSRHTVEWLFPILLSLVLVVSNLLFRRYASHSWIVHPSTIIINYIGLSVFLGSIAFCFELVAIPKDLSTYKGWNHYNHSSALFVLLIGAFVLGSCSGLRREYLNRGVINRTKISFLILMPFLSFFFIPLNLEVIGGSGDFSIVIKTSLAIFIIYRISFIKDAKFRWLLYFMIIFVFALFSVQEKREAIFLLFPMLYLEVTSRSLRFNIQNLLYSILGIAFILMLILGMSIARGYGDYGENLTLIEAFVFIDDYIRTPEFIIYFAQNIETNYLFFHALNSIELVLEDWGYLAYGSTFFKVFFIPFPRYLFPFKPSSILELYTTAYSPSFRSIEGSWVITVFSEFVWNFGVFGVFASYYFGRLIDIFSIKLFHSFRKRNSLRPIQLLFTYTILFTYVRGSGLDQFLLYWLIGISVIVYYYYVKKIFKCAGY